MQLERVAPHVLMAARHIRRGSRPSILPPPIPSQEDDLHKIFDNIDRTHSGLIDYTEFIAACLWSSKTLVSVPCAVCAGCHIMIAPSLLITAYLLWQVIIHLPYTAGDHPPSLYGR